MWKVTAADKKIDVCWWKRKEAADVELQRYLREARNKPSKIQAGICIT
jgi:hypothetical protein